MWNALLAKGIRHARYLRAAHHSAEIEHVRLHDRQATVRHQPAEVVRTRFLLAAGNGNLKASATCLVSSYQSKGTGSS